MNFTVFKWRIILFYSSLKRVAQLAAAIPGVEPEGGGGRSDVTDVYKSPSPKNNISPQEATI